MAEGAGPAATVEAADAIGFRLRRHHLLTRRPADELGAVAGACGVQNSPPGSAPLALHARAGGVTRERFDALIGTEKSLLQTWCMRGAPYVVPVADAPVFTTGVLPPTEAGRLRLIAGVEGALKRLGIGLDAMVERVAGEAGPVLAGRRLAIGELGRELAGRVAGGLSPSRRAAWEAPGPYGTNVALGEAVVHFCVRILTLRGVVCFAPRQANTAPFVLVEEWLGGPLPEMDPAAARAELLRRYLRCYGPSTRAAFAAWLGVSGGDARPWWDDLAGELVPVAFGGRRAWALAGDLEALRSPARPRGVRLLPPGDPYTQLRDRETIVAGEHRRQVWTTVGAPGTVLADGAIAGIWRPRTSGRRLALTVEAFRPLGAAARGAIEAEAAHVAAVRGAASAEVAYTGDADG